MQQLTLRAVIVLYAVTAYFVDACINFFRVVILGEKN